MNIFLAHGCAHSNPTMSWGAVPHQARIKSRDFEFEDESGPKPNLIIGVAITI